MSSDSMTLDSTLKQQLAGDASATDVRAEAEPRAGLGRLGFALGSAMFLTTVGSPLILADLPAKALLKNQLNVDRTQMALFFALAGIVWALKPLMGLLLDKMARRMSAGAVIVTASLAAAGGWLALALSQESYWDLLASFVVVNIAMVAASAMLGGVVVEWGQRHGATGRLTAIKMAARHAGYLSIGPLSGYLAKNYGFDTTCAVGLGILLTLAILATLTWPKANEMPTLGTPGFDAGLLRQRPLWIASAMIFVIEVCPGFDTLLYYIQGDTLKMDDAQIGLLRMFTGIGGIVAAGLYYSVCRHFKLRTVLIVATIINAAGALPFLAYRSVAAAQLISLSLGVTATIGLLPILDLATRATPKGIAAGGFAVVMGFWHLARYTSDLMGAKLYEDWGVPFNSLVLLNTGTTLLALVLLPLIPAALFAPSERASAHPGL